MNAQGFAGRAGFQRVLGDTLAWASVQGCREMQAWDASFVDWPLSDANVLAALTAYFLFGHTFELIPGAEFNWMQAGAAEFLYTMMLCFVVLNTACCRANAGNQYFGLAIGFVIVAGGFAVGI